MDRKQNISLWTGNIDKYSKVNGLSLQNLFYIKNRYFPNCYMFGNSRNDTDSYFDTIGLIDKIREKYGPKTWFQRVFCKRRLRFVLYKTFDFVEKEEYIGINVIIRNLNIFARIERSVGESYVLYGHDNTKDMEEFVGLLRENYKGPDKEPNNLYLVAQDQSGFHLNKYRIKPPKSFSLEKQYNDDFQKADAIINDFLNDKEKSGLVILHGDKGTGKTTYIRNIINQHPESKFVFVPSTMIRLLGEPAFGNFLMSLKNDVVILEDCEDVIKSRKSFSATGSAVSLLLNMGDGLLSDDLELKFICTFNENISNIDDALLRKGRLACKYEFKELSVDKANALLAEIYSDRDPVPTTYKPMSLADIYNLDSEAYTNDKKSII